MQGGKSVLVVEDDASLRELIAAVLEGQFAVVTVGSAEEALDWLRQSRPDIVLCDGRLGHSNGYTFVAGLRLHPQMADVPVVIMSGWEDGTCEERARAAGAMAFLPKPFNMLELCNLLWTCLRAHQGRPQPETETRQAA